MIPSQQQCLKILKKEKVPKNIVEHVKKVKEISLGIAEKLERKGIKVNKKLLIASALLHDIAKAKQGDHTIEGARLLEKLGFKEVAEVVKTHSLYHMKEFPPKTIEQKILFYADKITKGSEVVSVEERFEDFKRRYGKTEEEIREEYEFVKKIEKELFR